GDGLHDGAAAGGGTDGRRGGPGQAVGVRLVLVDGEGPGRRRCGGVLHGAPGRAEGPRPDGGDETATDGGGGQELPRPAGGVGRGRAAHVVGVRRRAGPGGAGAGIRRDGEPVGYDPAVGAAGGEGARVHGDGAGARGSQPHRRGRGGADGEGARGEGRRHGLRGRRVPGRRRRGDAVGDRAPRPRSPAPLAPVELGGAFAGSGLGRLVPGLTAADFLCTLQIG